MIEKIVNFFLRQSFFQEATAIKRVVEIYTNTIV